jgi:hypothetical protein
MTEPSTSERFRWLEQVRERQARQQRTRALRAELAAARAAGKQRRHDERLRRIRAGDTTTKGTTVTTTPTDMKGLAHDRRRESAAS